VARRAHRGMVRPTRSSRYGSRSVVANSLTTSCPTPPGERCELTLVRNDQGPWCFSLRVAQSFGAVRRRTRNNVGPVTTVPSRIAFPMRKSAAGAFRKSHVPSHHSPTDAVGAAGVRLASPTLHVLIASCFSIGAGMRTALAGAVCHPSVIDSEWTRVRCAIRSVNRRARSRDRLSPQRTRMTGRRWPAIRGPGDGWRSWDPIGDDVGRWSSRSRGSRDDERRLRTPTASLGRGTGNVAFAEGACGALPHQSHESGWDIVTGPTLFLLQRLTALKDCATHNETHQGL
jgi:hypothetical protein